jgi:hypothetical protein
MAIMLSEKKKNFDINSFTLDLKNKKPSLDNKAVKSSELRKYMKKPMAKQVFTMLIQRITNDNVKNADGRTKVFVSHTISE